MLHICYKHKYVYSLGNPFSRPITVKYRNPYAAGCAAIKGI